MKPLALLLVLLLSGCGHINNCFTGKGRCSSRGLKMVPDENCKRGDPEQCAPFGYDCREEAGGWKCRPATSPLVRQ